MKTTETDLVAIGGGPSGMLCAIRAAERGKRVVILDGNRFLGRKLRITGKGRCNLTNDCDVREVMRNIPGDGRFLYSALTRFPPEETMALFRSLGVPLKTERGTPDGKLTPELKKLLVEAGSSERGYREFRENLRMMLNRGINRSDIGAGYELARTLGHTVVPTRPSLVPLVSDDEFCAEMQGFSLRNVVLRAYEDDRLIYHELGEMLFTHFGVSGPLVLSASAHMRRMGQARYRLEIDLKPALDEKKLDERILRDFEKYANREFKNALDDLAARSMIPVLLRLSGIPEDTKVHSITREQRRRLAALFKAFPVSVSGFRPIAEAIVTAGGISTTEVNPRTMESKLVPGLYFAGEVLDLDAYTGGFNLQIAWATGHAAGCAIGAEEYNDKGETT